VGKKKASLDQCEGMLFLKMENEALDNGYIRCGRTFGTLLNLEANPVAFVE
jgi:hypothetical protein